MAGGVSGVMDKHMADTKREKNPETLIPPPIPSFRPLWRPTASFFRGHWAQDGEYRRRGALWPRGPSTLFRLPSLPITSSCPRGRRGRGQRDLLRCLGDELVQP